jgi:hypothetical protein
MIASSSSARLISEGEMMKGHINKIGFWSAIILVCLGLAYLCLILITMLGGSGFPPDEPFQTIFNILILCTAVWMVFFWVVINEAVPIEKKLFSQASLVMIVIFATLTSINRYVGLTVVKQSLSSGNTSGLQWFLPYSWPSVMLALEILAWGFFFSLACLSLAPVFVKGKLERAIFWSLLGTGLLSLFPAVGQVLGSNIINFTPFTIAGTVGWGPGLTVTALMIGIWFKRNTKISRQPEKI